MQYDLQWDTAYGAAHNGVPFVKVILVLQPGHEQQPLQIRNDEFVGRGRLRLYVIPSSESECLALSCSKSFEILAAAQQSRRVRGVRVQRFRQPFFLRSGKLAGYAYCKCTWSGDTASRVQPRSTSRSSVWMRVRRRSCASTNVLNSQTWLAPRGRWAATPGVLARIWLVPCSTRIWLVPCRCRALHCAHAKSPGRS